MSQDEDIKLEENDTIPSESIDENKGDNYYGI